jgi:mono/diheme cytochrome c family protein
VLGSAGKPVDEIVAALTGTPNADHDFSAVLDDQALLDLATFMSETVIDTTLLINEDKSSTGDAERGSALYTMCVGCHGPDGNAINFASLDEPEVLGNLASGNPWEALHKIRYGQPGWPMPSLVALGLTEQDANDVLAYTQTLTPELALSGGGILYDMWWAVTGADEPTGDHPLWATQNTNTRTGPDTWRCKECHGWDYRGADGAYGSGSHFTGFVGVLARLIRSLP